jgi:hypothetical protein
MIDDRKGYFLGDGFLEEKFAQINLSGGVAKNLIVGNPPGGKHH